MGRTSFVGRWITHSTLNMGITEELRNEARRLRQCAEIQRSSREMNRAMDADIRGIGSKFEVS
jgi:hypothetical protein